MQAPHSVGWRPTDLSDMKPGSFCVCVCVCVHPANDERRYIASSLIGWVQTQNDLCGSHYLITYRDLSTPPTQ